VASKSFDALTEGATQMSSTLTSLDENVKALLDVVNFQAAFIGEHSESYDKYVAQNTKQVSELAVTLESQKEEIKDVHERINRRRKEFDSLEALVCPWSWRFASTTIDIVLPVPGNGRSG
jgi:uncharacterized protein YukE